MISVIVAAYNCEEYIEKALKSIFAQTLSGKDYEVIVVNDGSTDNTLSILDKYKDRIRVVDQPNKGLAAAYNRGIREANGDCIIRLDPDDYFDRELLSLTLDTLETMPEYHCVYTDRYEIDVLNNTKAEVRVGEGNVFDMIGCGVLFRREVFNKVGLHRDLLFEEYDFMLRFFDNGLKGYYLPKLLYYYVRHDSSMTSQQNYWQDGWKQLADLWHGEKLKKYVDIQVRLKGTSRFPLV